jgi:hypothetical protein
MMSRLRDQASSSVNLAGALHNEAKTAPDRRSEAALRLRRDQAGCIGTGTKR